MTLSMRDSSKIICTMDGADISTTMECIGDFSRTDSDMEKANGRPMTASARMEIGIWDSSSEALNNIEIQTIPSYLNA